MNIRKLSIQDRPQLEKLIFAIETSLPNKDFWLPINDTARKHFFDGEWTEFIGVFDSEVLVGAAALFYNEHEYGESASHLCLDGKRIAEIGRAMVHPDYRGQNLLYRLNLRLLEIAREKSIDVILATIHPENMPSKKSFEKLGFKKEKTYLKGGRYLRDIYVLALQRL